MENNKVTFDKSEFDLSKPVKGAFINKTGVIRVSLTDKFAEAGKKAGKRTHTKASKTI